MSDIIERYGKKNIALSFVSLSFFVYNFAGYNYFLNHYWKMTIKLVTPIITYLLYVNLRRFDSNKVITSISYSFFSIALGFLLAWIICDLGAYFPDIIQIQ